MEHSNGAAVTRVHGVPRSTCTMRVLAALSEKDAQYELVPVDLFAGEHKQPKFLTLQPFGVVPVLQDDKVTLFESRAIIRYIADRYKEEGTPLYGQTLEERGLVEQWMESESQNFTPAAQPIFYQLVIAPLRGAKPDLALVESGVGKLEKVLDIYDAQLGKHPYLTGSSFTLADLTHLPLAYYIISKTDKGEIFTSRKNIAAWWDRVSSRPSWKKIVALSGTS